MVIQAAVRPGQLIYVTPATRCRRPAPWPRKRRKALLKKAHETRQLIIEDDSNTSANFLGQPHPRCSAWTRITGSSTVGAAEVLAPGLRIGFIVAAPELIPRRAA